jgi:hypothetical protein
MKKLLLLHTFLFALNLGAATEQNIDPQNDIETIEQTEIETPSFLARLLAPHANKLKTISYILDGALIVSLARFYYNQKDEAFGLAFGLLTVLKIPFDIPTKWAMSKKHAFDLEALKKELTEQQAKADVA